ncbi:PREDICTED: serine protease inhibitor dipetalogastin-like [Nicrophorus vespilloides]|uniref:Serine protease inhibitor dipetalogastin-like n=1 Tax=Nicrophorus vespilloides TaxID=110193 RepID=A0ABM1M2J9_NICVS|nr:PREDICTED: serine protease inhibitor dipetalogastin-like [Nicrophorus vespilloides]
MKTIAFLLFSVLLGVCFAEDCPCTLENRPLCASNGVTYGNWCFFECAQRSDADLRIVYEGVCKVGRIERPRECICPDVYSPICTNFGTFGNSCQLACFQMANPDKAAVIECKGECPCILS